MGAPVAQLLLESVLAPFVLVGLVLTVVRWMDRGRLVACAEAIAVILALGMTYVLALGWPGDLVLNAKSKIVLSAIIGLVAGIAFSGRATTGRMVLITGAVGIPLWLGLPALEQGRLESALLALPIAMALATPWLIDIPEVDGAAPASAAAEILIALTIAVGLATIAIFAKEFSYAELCLSLGSALLATLTIGQGRLAAPALITVATALLASITGLLLYSEASLIALLVLSSVIGAKRLVRLTSSGRTGKPALIHTAIVCALPVSAAILIARIDAGPFSIY